MQRGKENLRTRRKTLGARMRLSNNKLNPNVTPGLGIEPEPQWWEASDLTTAPSLLQWRTVWRISTMRLGWKGLNRIKANQK